MLTIRRALAQLIEVPGAGDRIIPFEGMRGYAVLLVFLVHYHSLFGQLLPPSSVLFDLSQLAHDIGQSGVDMFFGFRCEVLGMVRLWAGQVG